MTDICDVRKKFKLVLTLTAAIGVAGCFPDQANRTSTAQAGAPSAPDNVSQPALVAGLLEMQGRVRRKVVAYTEIVPTATSRYFMHPSMEKDAVLELDVSNLSSLTLSPRIGELKGDCLRDPDAGVVEFSYALDDAKPTRIRVDRNYQELPVVDLAGTKKMTIAANKGNGVTTCDWFGVGFLNIRTVPGGGH